MEGEGAVSAKMSPTKSEQMAPLQTLVSVEPLLAALQPPGTVPYWGNSALLMESPESRPILASIVVVLPKWSVRGLGWTLTAQGVVWGWKCSGSLSEMQALQPHWAQ